MRENTDQNNSEYGHLLRSDSELTYTSRSNLVLLNHTFNTEAATQLEGCFCQ